LGTPAAFFAEASLPFAQFQPGAFLDVDATDGRQPQVLSLSVSDAEPSTQCIGREALGIRLLREFGCVSLGNVAAHADGRLPERPNRVCGFGVVPLKGDQPPLEILSIGGLYVASMSRNLAAALGFKIKVA
jgi:hypothetical protein